MKHRLDRKRLIRMLEKLIADLEYLDDGCALDSIDRDLRITEAMARAKLILDQVM